MAYVSSNLEAKHKMRGSSWPSDVYVPVSVVAMSNAFIQFQTVGCSDDLAQQLKPHHLTLATLTAAAVGRLLDARPMQPGMC